VDGIPAKSDSTGTGWVKERLDQFRVQILNAVGATRDAYARVQEQTTVPEAVTVQLRQNERAATKDAKGDDLPRFHGHVFADADETFPVALNDWERSLVEAELAHDGFEAWYRTMKSGCHLNQASIAHTTPKVTRKSPISVRRQPESNLSVIAGAVGVIVPSGRESPRASPEPPPGLIELLAAELAPREPLAEDFLRRRTRCPSGPWAVHDQPDRPNCC
jgi:hypothetical protein